MYVPSKNKTIKLRGHFFNFEFNYSIYFDDLTFKSVIKKTQKQNQNILFWSLKRKPPY